MKSLLKRLQLLLLIFRITAASSTPVPSCPQRCICINGPSLHISCENAGLVDIPDEIHSFVTSLDMTRNSMKQLKSTPLNSLINLVDLKLKENAITTLSVATFRSLTSLQTLDLSSNNLTVLDKETFKDASRLVHLDLSNNQLKRIDRGFDGLTSLSRLDLRNNRLTSITHVTFSELTQLRYLRLDDNVISHIDSRAFADLDKLMYFVLKGNPIGNIETIHFSSQFLSYVDLSECDLIRVPKGLPNSVRYVQLRRNKMAVLSRDAFSGCSDVTIIVLDENNMAEVEDGAFQHLHNLQQLWMNGNQLENVPRPLPSSVKRLFLDSNHLQKLTGDEFPRDSQMNTLSLMGNNISFVSPKAFHRLSELKSLDLGGNQLRQILADTFAKNSQLQTLQLSKNLLENLERSCFHGLTDLRTLSLAYMSTDAYVHPDCLKDMTNLRKLDLDSSPGLLRSILESEELLASLSSVQDLSLENSEMVSLRQDFPEFFPNLAVLHISSSAWHCDSNLIWFRNWLISAPFHVETKTRNRCFTPQPLHDRAVTSLSDEDFVPATRPQHLPPPRPSPDAPDRPSTSTPYRKAPPVVQRVTPALGNVTTRVSKSPLDVGRSSSVRTWSGMPEAESPVDGGNSSRHLFQAGIITWEELLERLSLHDYEGRIFGEKRYEDLFSSPLNTGRFADDRGKNEGNSISTSPESSASTTLPPSPTTNPSTTGALINGITLTTVTVLVTVVIASVLIAFIVCLCRKRKSLPKQYPAENGLSLVHTGADVKKEIMYFMSPTSSKQGDLGKPQAVVMETETAREVMTLIPGRDVNHEGPMRVYKWEDF